MKTFKDIIKQDIKNTFMNDDEFSDKHLIDGKEMSVIIDGIELLEREKKLKDNPNENVLNGKVVFRQYLAPYTPAEDILNILEFDPSMIESALGGE